MAFDHAFNSIHPRTLKWYFAALRHDLFYHTLHRSTADLEDLGDPTLECNWTIRTSRLGPESVIYSAGVGRDITFEHALADRFGAKVILIDPSPTGIETMDDPLNRRAEFIFLDIALAGHDGELVLASPPDANEGSWVPDSAFKKSGSDNETIKVKCRKIESLMRDFGHRHVDLLKIDIEGAEYDVIDSLLTSGVKIRQIAVEFHNGVLPGISKSLTIRTLARMYLRGYRLVHKGGSNHTLYLAAEL